MILHFHNCSYHEIKAFVDTHRDSLSAVITAIIKKMAFSFPLLISFTDSKLEIKYDVTTFLNRLIAES